MTGPTRADPGRESGAGVSACDGCSTTNVPNGRREVTRCTDRRPCEDVLAFLRGADRSCELDGVDRDHPAVVALRDRAAANAAAHGYGVAS
jgi:hypothetical protein